MYCPFCNNKTTRVLESREVDTSTIIKRRRVCCRCKKRFTTYERVEVQPLLVLKNDGSREPFDREKLKRGIIEACAKRTVSLDSIERAVAEIEAELQEYLMEVPSRTIGKKVLEKLKSVDEVAYIRFASIYHKFSSVNTFLREIRKLKKEKEESVTVEQNIFGTSVPTAPQDKFL